MATKYKWKFWLFISGAIISSLTAFLEVILIVALSIEVNLYTASFFALSALLPIATLGAFWLDEKFHITYSKNEGIKITEEKKKKEKPIRRNYV